MNDSRALAVLFQRIWSRSCAAKDDISALSLARLGVGTHARYARFLEFGDADDYAARLEQFRLALGKKQ